MVLVEWLLDQQIRFCATPDGVRIAYATVGKGPPLVRAAHWLTHLQYDLTARSGVTGPGNYPSPTSTFGMMKGAADSQTGK